MSTRGLPVWPWTGAEAAALPAPERLMLDGLRVWRAAEAPLPALRLLLAAEDAAVAATPLDALLRVAPIQACAPLCPRVNPDEAALLLACAMAQRGARSEALAALLRLLPLPAAYAAMPAAIHLGAALRGAGLLLRNPIREALRPRPAARG
ncbi:hypothetical protein J5Y09_10540 [Roseomonas sp. PWR1]|uniref:Uncharacterized protein n=1 Tax=Roseomonas nitratireducens TaxID=2820810 RepID=A0ABS4AU95_9PROT|nr:hypothetical protein [Neoroseomonas nitratireducens]MBP0464351.1 hypothetical protein [Neoroseomonas nitratireducens]